MPDRTKELFPSIAAQSFPQQDAEPGFIFPAYQGQSILNIPASVCQLMDVPILRGEPLLPAILSPLQGKIQHIVLILVDAIALHRLKRWILEGKLPVWKTLLQQGQLSPITSIVPSTTSSALTTIWSGASTGEHAVAGYELWLKEYGMVTNMIQQSPMYYENDSGSLEKAGFVPEKALPMPTLGSHLLAHGVHPYSFQHSSITHSGLSRTFLRDVQMHSFSTAVELWVNVRQMLESKKNENCFFYVYWGAVDYLSHRFGPDDERSETEFAAFSQAFEQSFVNKFRQPHDNTLVILTSDHGQVFTPKAARFELQNHPRFLQMLHILPTGENRLAYLHIRPGQVEAVKDYIQSAWPDDFSAYDSEDLIKTGIFGPGDISPLLRGRIGDMTVFAKGAAYWWWAPKANNLLGRHGSLSPEEMLVPFLAALL